MVIDRVRREMTSRWQLGGETVLVRGLNSAWRAKIVCGRINLRTSPVELAEFFDLFREPEWLPRYNLGPMQQILVVRIKPDGVRLAEPVQWGLVPSWSRDTTGAAHMINARSDSVADKPAFRVPFRQQRCLIPASGFYEWQHIDRKTKQAWHIFRTDGQPLILAGLWEHWRAPDGDILESCAAMTTEANDSMAEIHTRMPVILSREMADVWLDPHLTDTVPLREMLVPCPSDWLAKNPVSQFVNQIHNDSPECIRPVKSLRTLF